MCLAYSKLRDLDQKPYSAEEAAVAEYLFQLIGIGGGDDPVGSLIVSHRELVRQRAVLRAKYPEIFDKIARDDPEFEEQVSQARKFMEDRRDPPRELGR